METEELFGSVPPDWKYKTLGAACTEGGGDIQTGPFGSQLHAADYVPVGIPSIMPQNIGDNRLKEEGIARIKPKDAQRLSRYLVRTGDIVYSRRGDVKRRALVRAHEDGWLCGTGCLRVRLGENGADPRFVSHYLGHPSVQEWIVRHAHGATMPNLNTSILGACPFLEPPIEEQRAIAHILGTLDDKIELNRKQNETLEEMARALFKAWFVDFEPVRAKMDGRWQRGQSLPGLPAHLYDLFPNRLVHSELGEVPEGWEIKKIENVITRLTVGKKYNKKTVTSEGRVPVLDQGKSGVIGYHNNEPGVIAANDNPVIVFANHTCYIRLICFPFSAIQNVLPFIGKNIPTIWVYYATYDKQHFIEYKGHWPDFIIHKIAVPSLNLTTEFANVVHNYLMQIWEKEYESRTLAQLRDTLLPKLISGELRVPDAERMVEQVS